MLTFSRKLFVTREALHELLKFRPHGNRSTRDDAFYACTFGLTSIHMVSLANPPRAKSLHLGCLVPCRHIPSSNSECTGRTRPCLEFRFAALLLYTVLV